MIARRKIANGSKNTSNKDNIYDLPKNRHPKHNSTSFKPGVAANPTGRPKEPVEFKQLIKQYTVEAANRIMYLAQYADDQKVQLQASCYIINRVYGMPVQANEISGPGGASLSPPNLVVNFVSVNSDNIINSQAEET